LYRIYKKAAGVHKVLGKEIRMKNQLCSNCRFFSPSGEKRKDPKDYGLDISFAGTCSELLMFISFPESEKGCHFRKPFPETIQYFKEKLK